MRRFLRHRRSYTMQRLQCKASSNGAHHHHHEVFMLSFCEHYKFLRSFLSSLEAQQYDLRRSDCNRAAL